MSSNSQNKPTGRPGSDASVSVNPYAIAAANKKKPPLPPSSTSSTSSTSYAYASANTTKLPPSSSSSALVAGTSGRTRAVPAAAHIHNPYAPLISNTTNRTIPSATDNNINSSSNKSGHDDGGSGILSQVQPMTFTQAFGDNDSPEPPSRRRQPQQQPQQQEQLNLTGSSSVDGISCRTTTAATGISSNTGDQQDKRVAHRMIAKHVLGVSTRQKGNPILHHIRNVPFDYFDMIPDYIMSPTSCALYLSLKYHRLYPDYIHRRLGELRNDFKLRVLLVLVDVSDNADLIFQVNRLGVVNSMTLVLAWSEAEAGRYLETYKALDGKDASSIQKRESNHIIDQMQDFWTACKPVNKTDANNLWEHFGNLKTVVKASRDEWALVSGLGPVKIQRLFEALHKPFSSRATRKRKREREEAEKVKKLQQQEEQEDLDTESVAHCEQGDDDDQKTSSALSKS